MSRYQEPPEDAPSSPPSPALSGVNDHHRQEPVSPHVTEQSQSTSGNGQNTERSSDAIDVSQALREIYELICQLNSTLHNSNQSGTVTPYQQASLDVLANIADDVSECLIWLREMGNRNEATPRPEQPTLQAGAPNNNIAPVWWRDNTMASELQGITGALPRDGLVGVHPSVVYHASGPYEGPTGAGQHLQGQMGGDGYHLHPEVNPQAYPYFQSQLPFPPSPGLYQNQWVHSPPVSPLNPDSFWHQQQHQQQYQRRPFVNPDPQNFPSTATFPGREAVPPPPNPTPNDTHQRPPLHEGQGPQQRQQQPPPYPPPGAGVTISLPLHYDTPAGPRMALYRSYLPGHPSGLSSSRPVSREPPVQSSVASSAAVPGLAAAETPHPSQQVSIGCDEHRSSADSWEWFARVDNDSEDSLDGAEEARFGWNNAFGFALSP